jgi:hypothetical protein
MVMLCDVGMTAATAPAPTRTRAKRLNPTLSLFAVDAVLAVLFVLVIEVPLTGLAVHEWLGIAIGAGMVTHLVQHAGWAGTTAKRIFGRTSFRNRLNYLMMAAMFVGFVTIIASGLLISETALPATGFRPPASEFWAWLHLTSVVWVMGLTAFHLAINWKWLVSTVQRYVLAPHHRVVRREVVR